MNRMKEAAVVFANCQISHPFSVTHCKVRVVPSVRMYQLSFSSKIKMGREKYSPTDLSEIEVLFVVKTAEGTDSRLNLQRRG